MYCSLQEAWPEFNYTIPNATKSRSDYELNHTIDRNQQIERFDQMPINQMPINQMPINQIPIINKSFDTESRPELVNRAYSRTENFTDAKQQNMQNKLNQYQIETYKRIQSQKDKECQDFLRHLDECETCRINIASRLNKPNKLADLLTTNPQLKETIMVFLIGIVILMVLNLFYK
jgi:hypothetical protein